MFEELVAITTFRDFVVPLNFVYQLNFVFIADKASQQNNQKLNSSLVIARAKILSSSVSRSNALDLLIIENIRGWICCCWSFSCLATDYDPYENNFNEEIRNLRTNPICFKPRSLGWLNVKHKTHHVYKPLLFKQVAMRYSTRKIKKMFFFCLGVS